MVTTTNDNGLMRIAEVAQYLSVSRSKVYQLMDSGELAWIKLGRLRRIARTELLHMMERHSSASHSGDN